MVIISKAQTSGRLRDNCQFCIDNNRICRLCSFELADVFCKIEPAFLFTNFFVYRACTGALSIAVSIGITGFPEAFSGIDNCGENHIMWFLFFYGSD